MDLRFAFPHLVCLALEWPISHEVGNKRQTLQSDLFMGMPTLRPTLRWIKMSSSLVASEEKRSRKSMSPKNFKPLPTQQRQHYLVHYKEYLAASIDNQRQPDLPYRHHPTLHGILLNLIHLLFPTISQQTILYNMTTELLRKITRRPSRIEPNQSPVVHHLSMHHQPPRLPPQ